MLSIKIFDSNAKPALRQALLDAMLSLRAAPLLPAATPRRALPQKRSGVLRAAFAGACSVAPAACS